MPISYDPIKNQANVKVRGLSFDLVADFKFADALIWQDTRNPYPEARFAALGMIQKRLYALIFTDVPDGIRVISFRKANAREVIKYEQRT